MAALITIFISYLILLFMPSLLFLCIPNKKKWFFTALTLLFILYSGLLYRGGARGLDVIPHGIVPLFVFLPVILAKYFAVVQNAKGHKKAARMLPIFGLLWPIIFIAIFSNNKITDFLEDVIHSTTRDVYALTKHVRISGVDYDIPAVYLNSRGYGEEKEIYLHAIWPGFLASPRSEGYIFRKGGQKQIMRLAAHAPEGFISLEKLADNYKETTRPAGRRCALESYDFSDSKNIDNGELHISRDNSGQIISVLNCSDDYYISGRPNNPLCRHYFSDGQLTYEVTYSKLYLKDWKGIQEKIRALFKTFRERAKEKGLDKVQIPPNFVDPSISRHPALP
jgi:hypothetical protein